MTLRRIPIEKRDRPRKRVLKGGVIAYSGRNVTLSCLVRDISQTGARLQVEQISVVPDTFVLIVELDGLEVPCAVAWRKGNELGVSFEATPNQVAPRRSQALRSPTARSSLRRSVVAAPPLPANTMQPARAQAIKPPVPLVSIPILIADDDPDDRLLLQDAFKESNFQHPITFVEDGEELLRYLRGAEPYANRIRPGLIVLDLNMPRMDGRTALLHLKTDATWKRIPVIVLTTSNAEEDVHRTYDLGVSAFIPKPNSVERLTDIVGMLNNYWLRFVTSPVA